MQKPTYEELLELLDDVSASAETIFLQFQREMFYEDRIHRDRIIKQAREVCDALLRQEDEEED